MNKPLRIMLAAAVLGSGQAFALDTMRCGSRLASTGMSAAEVLAACGEPTLRDVWPLPPSAPGYLGAVEQWTYDFGSNRLLQLLRFRQGRLQDIDSDGRGFAAGGSGDCRDAAIVPGTSKYRLLAQCGEPLTRSADWLQAPVDRNRVHDSRQLPAYWETVYREEWVYNFGSSRLMRIVRLDNGRVVEVQTGARGFER